MNKSGFVIARSKKGEQYFTSASAYDRPRWTPLTEATVYTTVIQAEGAATKLRKNGAFDVRVLPIEELATAEVEPRYGDLSRELEDPDSTEATGSLDDSELGGEDEMAAAELGDVCPTCDHEPCTCEDELSDDLDIELAKAEQEVDGGGIEDDLGLDPEVDPELSDEIGLGDEEIPLDGEDEDDLTDELPIETIAIRRESVEDTLPVTGAVADPNRDAKTTVADANDVTIKVPSTVLAGIKEVQDKFKNCSDPATTHDDAQSSFCLTMQAAAQTLLDCLNTKTVEGLKMAQVKLSSFMSPISSQFPPVVLKFINSGGQTASLKDMYDEKWATRRNQDGVL